MDRRPEEDNMRVSDLMSSQVIATRSEDSIATLHNLMLEHDIRHIPVVNPENELVGLVSHRDLLRQSLVEQSDVPEFIEDEVRERITVGEVMTTGVLSIEPDADIREAAQAMYENKFGSLPVVEGDHLVGILTESDFVRLMAEGN